MNREHLKRRIALFFAGTVINALGITLITKAYLGTSPISSLPFVLSLGFAPSFGMLTFMFNMLFLVGQIVILREEFDKLQILQIPVTVIFSLLIDGFMYIFRNVKPAHYVYSLLLLVLGCFVMAAGITLAVSANLILTPGNAFVKALSNLTGKAYGNVEIAFDSTLTVLAVIASFLLFGRFRGVREGTVISSFLVGTFINIIHRVFAEFFRREEEYSR